MMLTIFLRSPDLKKVWATANVYETDIAKIKQG